MKIKLKKEITKITQNFPIMFTQATFVHKAFRISFQ